MEEGEESEGIGVGRRGAEKQQLVLDNGVEQSGRVGVGQVDQGRTWGGMGEIEGEEGAGGRRAVGVDVLQKRRAGGELAAWYQRGLAKGMGYLCSSKR